MAALGAHFTAIGLRRVGMLGMAAVMGSRFYGLPGVEVVAPEGEAMGRVDADYKALARAAAEGHCVKNAAELQQASIIF